MDADVPRGVVESLVARVAELERTQRTENVEGFLALFTYGATWVTGGGQRLVGRDQIAEFTRQVLPGAFTSGSVRYEVELIRRLSDEVVVTGVAQTYFNDDGTATGRGLPTYVWVLGGDGTWRIAVGQNTAAS